MQKSIFSKARVASATNSVRRSVSSALRVGAALAPLQKTLGDAAPAPARAVFYTISKNTLSAKEADGIVEIGFTGQDLINEDTDELNFDKLTLYLKSNPNESITGEFFEAEGEKVVFKFDFHDKPAGAYQVKYKNAKGIWRFPTLGLTIQAPPARERREESLEERVEDVQLGGVYPPLFYNADTATECVLTAVAISGDPDRFVLEFGRGEEIPEYELRPIPLDQRIVGGRGREDRKQILLKLRYKGKAQMRDLTMDNPRAWRSVYLTAISSKTGARDSLEFFVPKNSIS